MRFWGSSHLFFFKYSNEFCCLHCRQELINYIYLHIFKFKASMSWGRCPSLRDVCVGGSVSFRGLNITGSGFCLVKRFAWYRHGCSFSVLVWYAKMVYFHLTLRILFSRPTWILLLSATKPVILKARYVFQRHLKSKWPRYFNNSVSANYSLYLFLPWWVKASRFHVTSYSMTILPPYTHTHKHTQHNVPSDSCSLLMGS